MKIADFAVGHLPDWSGWRGPARASRATGQPKLDATPNRVNATSGVRRRASGVSVRGRLTFALLFASLAASACSRTARPVPVPQDLATWPTVLESSRRDAWLDEQAPELPVREWTVDLGRGVNAPLAIASDLLFATTVDRRLVVLAASTGSFFWERRLPGAAVDGAVFDRTSVFVGAQEREGAAEAYELARGFLVWSMDLEPPVGAPLLHEGDTYWGTETGRVYALSAADGTQRWRADLSGGVVATPVVDGTDLLIATNADTLYRVEMRTGRATARLPLPSTVSATPAFDGTRLHLPMHDTTHVVVDVPGWRVASIDSLDAPARGAPLLDHDGGVFLLTDHATVWRVDADRPAARVVELGGAARASIALASNGLLVGRLDGALFFLRRDGTVVWREDFDDSIEAPVAVWRGAVYVPLLRGGLVKLRGGRGS